VLPISPARGNETTFALKGEKENEKKKLYSFGISERKRQSKGISQKSFAI